MAEADSYVAKWLTREPEMELALVFCAPQERALFALWGALLNELDEAVFELSATSVAQAKLAWWSDELARGARGAARHPLLGEFFRQHATHRVDSGHWQTLGTAAMRLAAEEGAPVDMADSLDRHRPYCEALARVESQLFEVASPASALGVDQLLRRLPASASGAAMAAVRWPLQMLARHQIGLGDLTQDPRPDAAARLVRDYAGELLSILERHPGGPLIRRSRAAFDRWRLRQLAAGRFDACSPGRFGTLWLTWRAARGAARAAPVRG